MGGLGLIVLDTHALVWWVSDQRNLLGPAARAAITKFEKREATLLVSAISAWEIAVLVSKSRLMLSMDVEEWLDHVASLPAIRFIPVDRLTSVQSIRLPGEFHPDPADRIIVATARRLNVALVTGDQKIRDYSHVKTIW